MADLRSCPACRKDRAANALVCPHCGHRRHRVTGAVAVAGLIVVLAILFLVWITPSRTPEEMAKDWVRQNQPIRR